MPLPILPSTTDLRTVTERVNPLIKDYNREDTRVPIFALDTGSATAYAIAPIPGIEMYVVGQIFVFKAANANSGTAPTLAVNGLTAGTITYPNGGALTAGDIPASAFVEVVVASTTPTFHLLTRSVVAISNTGATTFLGANVGTGVAGTLTAGPNTGSIGANGWVLLLTGTATLNDTADAQFVVDIHNGTSTLVNTTALVRGNANITASVSVVVTLSAATTFTLRVADMTTNNGTIMTTGSAAAANKATSITWVRIA